MIAIHRYLRLERCSLLLVALISSVSAVSTQTSYAQITPLERRIAKDLESTQIAEQKHLPAAQQGALWKQVALDYHLAAEFPKAEDAYNKALHLLKDAPSAREEYVSTLDDLSALYLSYGRLQDAETVRKQVIKALQKLGNPIDIAVSEVHLADIDLVRRKYKKAEQLASRGLEVLESTPDPPRVGTLSAYIVLAYARCSQGHCSEGLTNAGQAVAFANKKFGREPAAIGFAMETLGFAEWKSGKTEAAERDMLRAIQLLRASLVQGDPRLAGAMLQYSSYLLETNRRAEAQEIHEQVTRIMNQAGVFCKGCTVSVSSLSNAFR
jgi:tetratricopeptide (TPR) repeat protein